MKDGYGIVTATRNIKFDVIIPRSKALEFAESFGKEFIKKDPTQKHYSSNFIDSYFSHPKGQLVRVVIIQEEEDKFFDFLRKFCKNKKILFFNNLFQEKQ